VRISASAAFSVPVAAVIRAPLVVKSLRISSGIIRAMPAKQIKRSALVAYSARQMFDLVNDVASYPQFLSGCLAGEITRRWPQRYEAVLTFSLAGMRQRLTTRNRLLETRRVEMTLIDGPFRSLEGCWRFRDIGDEGSRVSLDMNFAMSGLLLPFSLAFAQMADTMVDAFCLRADHIHG